MEKVRKLKEKNGSEEMGEESFQQNLEERKYEFLSSRRKNVVPKAGEKKKTGSEKAENKCETWVKG